jgi:hypothetical protein
VVEAPVQRAELYNESDYVWHSIGAGFIILDGCMASLVIAGMILG